MDTGSRLASIDLDAEAGLVVHMHEAVHCLCFSGATDLFDLQPGCRDHLGPFCQLIARNHLRADIAARARPVFNDDRSAPCLRQHPPHHAREVIVGAAGG